MSVSARVCPVCARPVAPRAGNAAFPFCGKSCKLVDLGRWLDGTYRVPSDDGAAGDGDDAAVSDET